MAFEVGQRVQVRTDLGGVPAPMPGCFGYVSNIMAQTLIYVSIDGDSRSARLYYVEELRAVAQVPIESELDALLGGE